MPDSRLLWRALAWLGALLLIGSMWPIICAARPFPSYRDFSGRRQIGTESNAVNYSTTQRPSDLNNFFNVLTNRNDTNARTENVMTLNKSVAIANTRNGHPMVLRRRKTYESNRITADTIKSIFKGKQPRMHPNFNYQNSENLMRNRHDRPTMNSNMNNINASHVSPAGQIKLETTAVDNAVESITSTERSQELTTAAALVNIDPLIPSDTVDTDANNNKDILSSIIRAQHKMNDNTDANKLNRIITSTPSQLDDHPKAITTTEATIQAPSTRTRTTTIQSVFLDYRNFNEALTLPIDNLFNSTTKNNQAVPRSNRDVPSTTTTKTPAPTRMTTTAAVAVTAKAKEKATATNANKRKKRLKTNSNLERNERSANLSLAKTSKRIQLLIKGRLLQILPDGTVNGTQNDESDHSKHLFSLNFKTFLFFKLKCVVCTLKNALEIF